MSPLPPPDAMRSGNDGGAGVVFAVAVSRRIRRFVGGAGRQVGFDAEAKFPGHLDRTLKKFGENSLIIGVVGGVCRANHLEILPQLDGRNNNVLFK
jgi:hypothetical protein